MIEEDKLPPAGTEGGTGTESWCSRLQQVRLCVSGFQREIPNRTNESRRAFLQGVRTLQPQQLQPALSPSISIYFSSSRDSNKQI